MSPTVVALKICITLAIINEAYLLEPEIKADEGDCTISPEEKGVCIVLRKCQVLRGKSAAVRKAGCGYDGLEPKVCCPLSPPVSTAAATTEKMPSNTTLSQFDPTKYYQENCGFSNYTHGRVVGGVESEQGAWPWLAALAYKDQETNTSNFACGGALISPTHILTAAHCVFDRNDLIFVRLGEHNIDSEDDGAHPIDVDIAEKVLHPQFNPFTYEYDIAILRLTDAVNYTYEIRPICLPESPELESRSLTGSFPFVAGWGTVEYEGLKSSELREVQIPVIDSGGCNKAYKKLRRVIISERVLCAGFAKGGKDACQGDSGGPLMWPRGKTFYVIGIVSVGYRCAIPGFPGIYSRVTYFLNWIKSVAGI